MKANDADLRRDGIDPNVEAIKNATQPHKLHG
jgi:hypothetical protein